jgi:hypothetical protein
LDVILGGARVDVKGVEWLKPHEETIPGQAEVLAKDLLAAGVQKDPLVVDSGSGTVLDGMHRLAAFKSLGLGKAVCAMVDYSSPEVTLHRWVRVVMVGARSAAEELVDGLGGWRRSERSEALAMTEDESAIAVLGSGLNGVSELGEGGLKEGFEILRQLELKASQMGLPQTYAPEDELESVLADTGRLAVVLPRVSKAEVLEAAATGDLFPYKTTMHKVDPRPVGVKFPISELNGDGARAKLELILRGSRPRLLPAGSTYEGRRYQERLVVLTQG